MSKKLDAIIRKVPPATAREFESVISETVSLEERSEERSERIVAVIPASLKKQIKQYVVDHPGETEKTVLLKGLISLGFSISPQFLKDNRGRGGLL